jgi:hypothetical protein
VPRRQGLWARVKRLLGFGSEPPSAPPPPDEEPALVPSGPRRPTREGGAALDLPQEPDDVDAYGRDGG